MVKKIFKMALSLVMILRIVIAISNVSSLETGALDGEWEELHEYDAGCWFMESGIRELIRIL